MIAVDTETTGLGYYDEAFGVSIGDVDGGEWYEVPEHSAYVQRELAAQDTWVFHNAKFDLHKLLNAGLITREQISRTTIHDTECLAHLLDSSSRKALKHLAREILGKETDEEEQVKAARKKHKLRKADGYHLLPREVVVPYAIKDVEYTMELFHVLYPLVRQAGLLDVYAKEQRLQLVLLDMERQGMAVDTPYLEQATATFASDMFTEEMDIRDLTNEDFNPNSPKQILEVLNDRGNKVNGTSVEVLRGVNDPLAAHVLEYRRIKKIHGTYLKPMLHEQRDGLMHPWFRQHGTRTGRMASGGAEA
jgi:DNA polymerase-1